MSPIFLYKNKSGATRGTLRNGGLGWNLQIHILKMK